MAALWQKGFAAPGNAKESLEQRAYSVEQRAESKEAQRIKDKAGLKTKVRGKG